MNCLAYTLLLSSRAPARRGPNSGRPAPANTSATPLASGSSGPTTVKSTCSRSAAARIAAGSATSSGTQRARPAMPALPGPHTSSRTAASRPSFQARACSRAPLPTSNTFIGYSRTLATAAAFRLVSVVWFPVPTGSVEPPEGGDNGVGGSQSSARRVNRGCAAPLQAESPAGRYHQGYQEAFLLSETGRQAPREAGAGPETQPQEDAARVRLAARGGPDVGG